jgi:hypothetical protein
MLRNKYLFLFFLILFILSFSACRRKSIEIVIIPDALKNHLQRAHLFGNIHSIETDSYYFSDKDSLFIFLNKTWQFYSSDGYLTQVIVLDKNSDTVSIQNIHYLPNAQENYREEYFYKEQNLKKDTFLYDKNGFLSKQQIFNHGLLEYEIMYQTDTIGSIIEMKRLLPDYNLTNKIYYNEQGLVERIEEYDPNHNMYKYITLEYDNYGDEVNRRAFKNSSEMIEYTYTQYNNEGALLKIIFEDRLHSYREDKSYSHHDKAGNWLEEAVLQGNDTVRKRVRQIEYY